MQYVVGAAHDTHYIGLIIDALCIALIQIRNGIAICSAVGYLCTCKAAASQLTLKLLRIPIAICYITTKSTLCNGVTQSNNFQICWRCVITRTARGCCRCNSRSLVNLYRDFLRQARCNGFSIVCFPLLLELKGGWQTVRNGILRSNGTAIGLVAYFVSVRNRLFHNVVILYHIIDFSWQIRPGIRPVVVFL